MSGGAGRNLPVFVSCGPSFHTQGIANCYCWMVGKFPPGQAGFWRYLLGGGEFGHEIQVTVVGQVVMSSCIVQGVGLDDPVGPFQLYDSMIKIAFLGLGIRHNHTSVCIFYKTGICPATLQMKQCARPDQQ